MIKLRLKQSFTAEQKKDNLRLGIKALRENPKKATLTMQDNSGGRCCLCVLSHVAEDIMGYERDELTGSMLPTFNMSDVFGTNTILGAEANIMIDGVLASRYNDGDEHHTVNVHDDDREGDESRQIYIRAHEHTEIADLLEKEYLS